MYLIRRGEKPRPVCVACNRAGDQGLVVAADQPFICALCKSRIGKGLYIDPVRLAERRNLGVKRAV